ncbi:phage antirepressor KilAC domain-containing protein [Pseudomonas rhodesiae]|uniref:phage antirepressor KilAC domain-containing protein n=1 Tax=Pseudomonas rhodesiae TaxID=76760 RepID=UPI00215ECD63|nr:phage antirepressor KilAC domain-containing protein [Pseudomonas rhodesiae]UVL07323.1 phage antirepressor KilAC domain-containing protein [Pseudomonas rhodesiae]
MNTLVAPSNTVTMSTREIADLTGKQHKNVLRDVNVMLDALEKTGSDLSQAIRYTDERGRTSEVRLDRVLTETLLTGYSIPLRHRVVTRLAELEKVSRHTISMPSNFAEALQLAADQAKHNASLHQVIQQQAPKVLALERLSATQGSICITSAAKQLGVGPMKLFKWLSDNRWIYRRAAFSAWSAYQPRLTAGLLEHKLVKVGKGDEQDLKVVEQVMVTRKGITTLAEQLQGNSL